MRIDETPRKRGWEGEDCLGRLAGEVIQAEVLWEALTLSSFLSTKGENVLH